MKRANKILLIIILIFCGLVLLRLAIKKPGAQIPTTGRRTVEKVTVKAMPVKREDLNFILSYVGSIKAKDEINVFSKVPGKLLTYVASEGQAMEKGQTIALIDRDETGLKFELAPVKSPINGVLGRTLLDKGANILSTSGIVGGTPLAIVVNMDEMTVKINVPEPDIPYMKNGLEAQIKVDAYPDENFEGEVTKVSEVVDPGTRTLPIEITIPNPDHKLKSGMFARIKIIADQHKNALVLLQDTLVQELGANYVFIVEDHIARKKKVTTGIREDSKIEILEGLQEGQLVIVFGQQGLKDGTLVETVKE